MLYVNDIAIGNFKESSGRSNYRFFSMGKASFGYELNVIVRGVDLSSLVGYVDVRIEGEGKPISCPQCTISKDSTDYIIKGFKRTR